MENTINTWAEAISALPDKDFFNLMRLYLGKIQTPYNKQRLASQLASFLKTPKNTKAILTLLTAKDLEFLSALYFMEGIDKESLLQFFSGSYQISEFYTKLANLRDRLLIYSVTKDDGKTYLLLNPVLLPSLEGLLNIEELLPPPQVMNLSMDDNFVLTQEFLASFISCVRNNTFTLKNDGSLKKNAVNEKKFFEALNSLNTDTSKNMYQVVSLDNVYFKVDYKYKIDEFNKYRTKDVRKYFKRIEDDLNALSYELATLTVLKANMLNKDINLLFPASLDFYRKEIEINKLAKVTSNECIKNKIKLLIDYDDYYKNKEVIRFLINAGFGLALDFNINTDVAYRTFNEIKVALVTQEFLKANKSNVDSWKESGVAFIIKSEVNNEISEMKLLGLEEK